ncbi:MAG: hypothetical protein ACRD3J_24250 [Thermoanaerobaculia bacterium]
MSAVIWPRCQDPHPRLLEASSDLAPVNYYRCERCGLVWTQAEHTIRSYQHDLEDFALFFSRALAITPVMSTTDALSRLFKQSAPSAHEIVLGFRHHLASAHMARRRRSTGTWRHCGQSPSSDGCSA